MKLVLCQLYPEHLSIYADRGNVQVIRRRLEWRGLELEERPLRVGESLDPEAADRLWTLSEETTGARP